MTIVLSERFILTVIEGTTFHLKILHHYNNKKNKQNIFYLCETNKIIDVQRFFVLSPSSPLHAFSFWVEITFICFLVILTNNKNISSKKRITKTFIVRR